MAALPIVDATEGRSGLVVSIANKEEAGEILTLSNNVTSDIAAKSQIAGDGDKQVDAARTANAGQNDGCGLERAIILYFVENGEHLKM